MDSSVSLKDEIWFLRVYHHISTGLYCSVGSPGCITKRMTYLAHDPVFAQSESDISFLNGAISLPVPVFCNHWSGWHSWFVFQRFWFHVTVLRLAVMCLQFRGLPPSVQARSGFECQIRPKPLPSTLFTNHRASKSSCTFLIAYSASIHAILL